MQISDCIQIWPGDSILPAPSSESAPSVNDGVTLECVSVFQTLSGRAELVQQLTGQPIWPASTPITSYSNQSVISPDTCPPSSLPMFITPCTPAGHALTHEPSSVRSALEVREHVHLRAPAWQSQPSDSKKSTVCLSSSSQFILFFFKMLFCSVVLNDLMMGVKQPLHLGEADGCDNTITNILIWTFWHFCLNTNNFNMILLLICFWSFSPQISHHPHDRAALPVWTEGDLWHQSHVAAGLRLTIGNNPSNSNPNITTVT